MILPWLILIPFIGGFLCWLGERFGATLPRWIALLTMSLLLGIGLWLWGNGDYTLAPLRAPSLPGPWNTKSSGSSASASASTWPSTACRC